MISVFMTVSSLVGTFSNCHGINVNRQPVAPAPLEGRSDISVVGLSWALLEQFELLSLFRCAVDHDRINMFANPSSDFSSTSFILVILIPECSISRCLPKIHRTSNPFSKNRNCLGICCLECSFGKMVKDFLTRHVAFGKPKKTLAFINHFTCQILHVSIAHFLTTTPS